MTAGTPPPPASSKPEDDPDQTSRSATIPNQIPTITGLAHRKKGTSIRSWLVLDSTAQTMTVEAGKHSIMRRTGLPGRDLRILDPLLSYPSTVLGRERAIVINLEHIKAIIMAQEVLLLNSKDPSVTPFVNELQRRIQLHYQANQSKESAIDESNCIIRTTSQNLLPRISQLQNQNEEGKAEENQEGKTILPFEFVALEACLEAACGCLESETTTLEQEAHPALDRLTSKISTLNLERVRQIKSRLVAITGRVQKVRDELEHLLDDDDDMADMYLTEKQQIENSSTASLNERDELDEQEEEEEVVEPDNDDSTPAEAPLTPCHEGDYTRDSDKPHDHSFDAATGRGSHGSRSSSGHSFIGKTLNVQELEMLLEAYFVQADGTLNKLSTLREYVDDTEDYINIMLDDKQNHLLRMGVMLSTATLVISAFVVVAGIFGMNIHIELFDDDKAGMPEFLWTIGGSTAGAVFLYVVAISWCKHKGLLG